MKTIKDMMYILSKKEKFGFVVLFFGMLLSSFLEVIGLAILVPVVNIVAYPDTAMQNSWYLQLFVKVFQVPQSDTKLLLIVFIFFIATVYILKALYYFFFHWWQQTFISRFSRRISIGLFENYLYQPYEFHVYHNTAELISRATYDVSGFTGGVSIILSSISDVLFAVVVFIYLMISEWAITLIIFAGLGVAAIFLNWLFKKKARAYGREAAIVNAEKLKAIKEGLSGIKETKIAGREPYFVNVYNSTMKESQDLSIKRGVIEIIPRTAVEALGMIGMLLGLMVYYLIGTPPEQILNTFTLLAIATVKLLPYVTRISAQVNSFRGASWSIHRVTEDLHLLREIPVDTGKKERVAIPFEKGISINHVVFQYKSGIEPVLQDVSALIPKGKSVAFCGRSGAGKTTTIDVLLGLLKPQQGSVMCDDIDVADDLNGWHENLAYVPQDIYLIDDTIRSNVAFGYAANEVKEEDVWMALEKAQLGDFVRGLPNGLQTKIGEKGVRLSGGQRQRIGIARALFRNTPILILDEATSALDYETEGDILRSVEGLKGEKTLIIITHRLNTIESCDKIYEIKDNKMSCIKG